MSQTRLFDRVFWEEVQKWCTQYKEDACTELKKKDIVVSKSAIYQATVRAAMKHFELKGSWYAVMKSLTDLRSQQKADELKLSLKEFRNPKIRRDAQNGQTQLFLSQNS